MAILERGRVGRWRRALLANARGKVLEVGCGTGLNLPLYGPEARVVATEPDPLVLARARERAPNLPFVVARAEALPFASGTFDAAVSTLVFCSVDDAEKGLAEVRRVLRSDGTLHMLEHVRSENRLLGWLQDRLQPAWTWLAGGCRPNRDTVAAVESRGFRIEPDSFRSGGTLRSLRARPEGADAATATGAAGVATDETRRRRAVAMDDGPPQAGSRSEVRSYYRTVGEFLEMELALRKDREYWENLARKTRRPRILELGSGTGRVTRMVAPLAREVVGVDLSRWMLTRARKVLAGLDGVHLIQADMRRLPLRGRFDLVIAANDPLVHLSRGDDRDRVLRLVVDHLRPGGTFILDSFWLRPSTRHHAAQPGGWSRSRPIGPPGREVVVLESWTLDPDGWTGEVTYEYQEEGRTVAQASFRPRLWSPDEVRDRFSRAGLRIRGVFGDYRGTPWDPDSASCLLVEAERDMGGQGAPDHQAMTTP